MDELMKNVNHYLTTYGKKDEAIFQPASGIHDCHIFVHGQLVTGSGEPGPTSHSSDMELRKMNCQKTSLAVTLLALVFSVIIAASALAKTKNTTPPPPPLRYTITYLDPLEGTDFATCTHMNDSGQIVGWCGNNTDYARRYFLFVPNPDFTSGQMTDIADMIPEDSSDVTYSINRVCDINNRGQIALQAYQYVGGLYDRLYTLRLTPPDVQGEPWEMEVAEGGSSSSVTGVGQMNECGDIIGSWPTNEETDDEPISVIHTYVWPAESSGFIDLGTLDSQVNSIGRLISDRDTEGFVTIAGENGFQAGTFVFRYRIGSDPSLPDNLWKSLMSGIGDPTMTGSCAMNALGHIAGDAYVRGRWVWHAMVYYPEADTLTDLGTLGGEDSIARDINDFGDVVGQSDTKKDTSAFLFTEGAMWDLASLIDPDEHGELPYSMFGGHYVVYAGYCINNLRMICGPSSDYGTSTNDTPKAFLLVPYEP